ncbi:MAG: glycosyltransferase family 4 protein [Candidatus Heimdallarchaeota archaeon]|nr:glycosyltransferase family 4 protein [Candidatus Heimdallarchaeota archaeon]
MNILQDKRVGVLITTPRHGGGSYQWTINILNVLNDYRKSHSNITIHIFFVYLQYENVDELKSAFPDFHFYTIEKIEGFKSVFLRGLAMTIPFLIPHIRQFFPLNSNLKKEHINLMLFPTTLLDSSLCNQKHIFFLGDIAHVFYPWFPEVSENGQLRTRHILFKYGLQNADQIIVESKQLRKDIAKYYGADETKTNVLYQVLPQTLENMDFEDDECTNFKLNLPPRYIFYPAQLWEHKNHRNLLKAMKLVVKEFSDLYLILTGSRKKGDEQIFTLIEELKLSNNVKYYGYIEDKYLSILYKNAQALVMPTYFGPTNIPTLEAFYYGCPAIISEISGVIEQTRDAALLFKPNLPEDIASKIILVLKDDNLQKDMIQKGYERLNVLSYENYRNTLFAILEKNLM